MPLSVNSRKLQSGGGASNGSRLANYQSSSIECASLCRVRAIVYVPCIRFVDGFPARLSVLPIRFFCFLFLAYVVFCCCFFAFVRAL